jgi:hypothetical protein
MPKKLQHSPKRYSLEFGKKEKVLNYTSQTYQLTRPAKVGAVMALIRECQPATIEEWKQWFFENATTASKQPTRVTEESLTELGERLYSKIIEIVIPEWTAAFQQVTKQDCIDYIHNLTINRTYDGYLREKSVVFDELAKQFPFVRFEESDPVLDHAGDIDFLGHVGDKELRDFIIDVVSVKGGHFGASLGVVELTVALHYVFNTPYDQLVWDVGHQAYGHKILTGRREMFHTNRIHKGISGFPKRSESEYDTFGVGHSSTSIGGALGMAVASKLKGGRIAMCGHHRRWRHDGRAWPSRPSTTAAAPTATCWWCSTTTA